MKWSNVDSRAIVLEIRNRRMMAVGARRRAAGRARPRSYSEMATCDRRGRQRPPPPTASSWRVARCGTARRAPCIAAFTAFTDMNSACRHRSSTWVAADFNPGELPAASGAPPSSAAPSTMAATSCTAKEEARRMAGGATVRDADRARSHLAMASGVGALASA